MAFTATLFALHQRQRDKQAAQPEPPAPETPVVPARTSVPFADVGIGALSLTPDGKLLVVVSPLRVWDLENDREVKGFQSPDKTDSYMDVAVSPDGKAIAVGGSVKADEQNTGVVRLWDLETRQLRWSASPKSSVWCLTWSPDGSRLAAGDDNGTVTIWNADGTNERVAWRPSSRGESGTVERLTWSNDGKRIVSLSSPVAHLWEVETGREIAIATEASFFVRREMFRDRPLAATQEPDGHFNAFAFTPDDRSVFVSRWILGLDESGIAQTTGDVLVWDLEGNRESRKLAESPFSVLGVAVGPGGRSMVTANFSDPSTSERTVHAHGWDISSGRKLWTVSARTDEWPGNGRFAITPDHKRLAIRYRANGGLWFVNVYDLPPSP